MPSVCYIYRSPISIHHSFHSPFCPVGDLSADTPQPRSSVISVPLAQLCFVMYLQYVCLRTYSARLFCCFCLSLLSAHTGDLLLFLEERMKKCQFDRKYAWMKKIKIGSSSLPPPSLSLPVSLSLRLSFIFCSLPSLFHRFS